MKVISFCLWGDKPMYNVGAIRNAQLIPHIYPDWQGWFYVSSSVPQETIDQLNSFDHVKVISAGDESNWVCQLWRTLPVSIDSNVEIMISRDTDCRLNLREKHAVDEWLDSGEPFHLMRDHPYHTVPIMGGMWGCRVLPTLEILSERTHSDIKSLFAYFQKWQEIQIKFATGQIPKQEGYAGVSLDELTGVTQGSGIDQSFYRHIYEAMGKNIFSHDSFPHYNAFSGHNVTYINSLRIPCVGFPDKLKTPSDFVGQDWDENDIPTATSYQAILHARTKIAEGKVG